jgi:lysophospholipase L1-like esterase
MKLSIRTTGLAICLGLFGALENAGAQTSLPVSSSVQVGTFQKAQNFSRTVNARIMCIGDSNTHGVNAYSSYRYPLWFRLYHLGSNVNFVGTRFTVENENGTTIPNLNLFNRYYTYFDRDHQGYSGHRTEQVTPYLPQAVSIEQPNICIVLLGTNDIGQRGSSGINGALANMKALVQTVRGQAPTTTFLIASIPPIGPGTWYFNNSSSVPQFNTKLAQQIPTWNQALSPVHFVDIYNALDVNTDMLPDGIHPNQNGQQIVADTFYAALLPLIQGALLPPLQPAVNVQTQSFETLGLADGVASPQALSDWTYPNLPHLVSQVLNPNDLTYPGALGNGTPVGADGDEILSLENTGGDPSLGWIYQNLSTTFESGKGYEFNVAVGNRAPTNTRGTTSFGGYELQLLAGGIVIASSTNQVTPAPGTFAKATVSIANGTIHPQLAGSSLTLRMRMTWSTAQSATDFDMVELIKN